MVCVEAKDVRQPSTRVQAELTIYDAHVQWLGSPKQSFTLPRIGGLEWWFGDLNTRFLVKPKKEPVPNLQTSKPNQVGDDHDCAKDPSSFRFTPLESPCRQREFKVGSLIGV